MRKVKKSNFFLVVMMIFSMLIPNFNIISAQGSQQVSKAVYSDNLEKYWGNWSWASNNLSNTSPVHSGSSSIAIDFSPWSALNLHSDIDYYIDTYDTLKFFINGGTTGGQILTVQAFNGDNVANGSVKVTAKANEWTEVNVDLKALGVVDNFRYIRFSDATGTSQPTVYIDDIQLVGPGSNISTEPVNGPKLDIDASSDKHQISEDIYGMNYYGMEENAEELMKELRLPVCRFGGNATTTYNWQNNTVNAGNDWYFENSTYQTLANSVLPNGSYSDIYVDHTIKSGTKSMITIPMTGWVPKTHVANTPADCSFSVAKYGAQQKTDQYNPNAGNGILINGTKVINDPTDAYKAVGPDFMKDWINNLTSKYNTAKNGGVKFYSLDNEPELWDSSHMDIHPNKLTYEELVDKTISYAPTIKAADSSAMTIGPVTGLYAGETADKTSHNDMYLNEWYLTKLADYEKNNGTRLLDYFDIHYYPSTQDVSLSPAGDEAWQQVRLRSTRSLWDPTYIDESWTNKRMTIIPTAHAWIDKYYPGTKLSISEYNFGAAEHINGAVTQADVLGIFGREKVDMATLWGPPKTTEPMAYAFRMYRNYDGLGGSFGDMGVKATSADQGKVATYASVRESDGALTIMVINKTNQDQICPLNISSFSGADKAQVYRYSQANLSSIVTEPSIDLSSTGITTTLPKSSITLLVIPKADAPIINSKIDLTSATFDKNNQIDIETTMTLNGNTLSGIKNDNVSLVKDTDYTEVDGIVTIKSSYLSKLPIGNVNLTFDFSAGVDPVINVIVVNNLTIIKGDINNDGKVNIFDYIGLKKALLLQTDDKDLKVWDMNNDTKVNIFDYILLKKVIVGA